MKKILKRVLIALGVILLLLVIGGLITANKFKNTFLDFEKDYAEKTEFNDIEVDGLLFADRNGNGQLDAYEDHRLTLEERVENALSLMTTEEKIHLLKVLAWPRLWGKPNQVKESPVLWEPSSPLPDWDCLLSTFLMALPDCGFNRPVRAKTVPTTALPFPSAP